MQLLGGFRLNLGIGGKRGWIAPLVLISAVLTTRADQVIYTDSLQSGWIDYSWATVNFANSSPTHNGSASSISVSSTNWQALYLHHAAQNSALFTSISFWINGGATGGQSIQVQATRNGANQTNLVVLAPLPVNTWRQDSVSLAALGVGAVTDFDGFWLQVQNNGLAPTFYVDDIVLVTNANPAATVSLTSPASGASYLQPASIPLAASVTTNGHTISKVQFYSSTNLLGEDASPPYSFTWSNVLAGNYTLVARVVFDSGSTNDSAPVPVSVFTNTVALISINASSNRHAISPLIYGVAFGTSNQVADLQAPINRSGGNTETRYNWLINAHNRAADWYFESLADSTSTPGGTGDDHIANSKNGGAQPMITIPMIGWVPRLGPGRARLASYAITNYGLQAANDWQYFAQAGNGVITNTTIQITTNNPYDANFPTNSSLQQAYVQHLTNRWGISTNGGVRYYLMDNEHSIWFSTHRDIHNVGPTMQEIRDKFFDYASVVKSVDPSALVSAPEEWGWSGYLYSGYDQQWAGAHNDYNTSHYPDRGTNGGWDYGPWFLNQVHQHDTNANQRLLDYYTLHIYPQGGEGGNDVTPATQQLRNRSTRSLWDTNYVDQSWINSIVMLIPRMKNWVAAYYPGTKIGITEYNWGAEGYINGATAQADILGIFGREGLDLATRWETPAATTPTYKAMKMYRNYDGAGSGFGDTSVSCLGPNPDNVASFASVRSSDGALMAIVINKQLSAGAITTVAFTNFLPANTAQVWQLTSANAITRLPNLTFTGNSFSNTLPAQSVTLFVVPAGGPPRLRVGAVSPTNTFDLYLDGVTGQRYVLLSATNFTDWLPLQTNALLATTLHLVLPASGSQQLYRAKWQP
jgi:hypothetical protein